MKVISKSLILLFICLSELCYSQSTISEQYKFEIEIWNKVTEGSQIYYTVRTTLTNFSGDTLKYISMSCSWWDFYSVDNELLRVEPGLCDKNTYVFLKLAPGQSDKKELRLIVDKTANTSGTVFRMGFHMVAAQTFMDIYDFQSQLSENIVWSNVISL